MSKRKKKNTARPVPPGSSTAKAITILKRIIRRLGRGQQVPFLVAAVEPARHPKTGEVRAVPAILSLRLDDPEVSFLVKATLEHLVEVGALSTKPKDEDTQGPEKKLDVSAPAPDQD
jgi:hypothetical protein